MRVISSHPIKRQFIKLSSCVCLILTAFLTGWAQTPELVVQTGHTTLVTSVAFSPDDKILASSDNEGTVKLWDWSSGKVLQTLTAPGPTTAFDPNRGVNFVAFLPDGKTLLAASYSRIWVWDIATGQNRVFQNLSAWSNAFAVSSDGKMVAAGFQNNSVKLWDLTTGRELHTLYGHLDYVGAIAFSPNGSIVASAGSFYDKTIRLWDVATGQPIRVLTGATIGMRTLAFSPDGKTLVSDGDVNHGINWWDVETGRERKTVYGHADFITSVSFSHDGTLLLSAGGGEKGSVKVWDTATDRVLKSFSDSSMSATFSNDGRAIASAGGKIDINKLWDTESNVTVWDVATGRKERTLTGRSRAAYALASSQSGQIIAAIGNTKEIKLWNLAGGQVFRSLAAHDDSVSALALSPNGQILASAGRDNVIKLWDVYSGQLLKFVARTTGLPLGLRFSSDGKTFISLIMGANATYTDGTSTTYTTLGGTIKVWDTASGREVNSYHGYDAIGISEDGSLVASTNKDAQGKEDNTFKILNLTTGESMMLNGHTARGMLVQFSPDNKAVAAAGADNTIRVWNLATGQGVTINVGTTFSNIDTTQSRWAFSAKGALVIEDSQSKTVRFIDPKSGRELRSFRANAQTVRELFTDAPALFRFPFGQIVTSDGILQLRTAENGKLNLFDFATQELRASLIAFEKDNWAIVTPSGLFDGTVAAWRELMWRFDNKTFNSAPVEAFFSEFYYPGLLADIRAGKLPNASSDISQKDRRQPLLKLWTTDVIPDTQLTTRELRVKIDVAEVPADKDHKTSSGAQDVRLFRNGSLVKVWRGDVLNGHVSVTLEASIPIVAGENRLTAYCFNHDNIKSGDVELTITGAESLKRPGTAYILAVGINNYSNKRYNLKYAVADAEDFSSEVKRQQELLNRYEHVEVISLSDAEASKSNIIHEFTQLATRAQPEDIVIIYFAGHGTAHGNHFYLIPHDLGYNGSRTRLTERSLQTILAHSISDRELEKVFEGIDAAQLLLVIDACNSGQALEAEEKRRGPMNSKGLAQLAYEKGMHVLTAAQSYQAAQEAVRFGHGFLTYALVERGLKQGIADREPKDGAIDVREWLNFATDEVPRMQDENILDALRGRGRYLNFAGDGSGAKDPTRNTQRPRIFYRGDYEPNPLVIAVVPATGSK